MLNLFSICITFEFRISDEPVTQYTHESHVNVNHMRTLKNSLPYHAASNCIMIHITTLMQTLKANAMSDVNPKSEHNVCETSQCIMIGS